MSLLGITQYILQTPLLARAFSLYMYVCNQEFWVGQSSYFIYYLKLSCNIQLYIKLMFQSLDIIQYTCCFLFFFYRISFSICRSASCILLGQLHHCSLLENTFSILFSTSGGQQAHPTNIHYHVISYTRCPFDCCILNRWF